jgi:hypothetical protein
MRPQTQPKTFQPTASALSDRGDDPPTDARFRALLADQDWARLPSPVRQRFSRRLGAGGATVFVGEVRRARLTRIGRLFVQAARLVGAPLPTSGDEAVPVIVSVTEDMTGGLVSGGQIWTLVYGRRRGFPQVIHSAKNFSGPTGLEERLRFGIRIALSVLAEDRALVFRSGDYFWCVAGSRLRLPRWLTPGRLTVKHIDIDGEAFMFSLSVVHPRAGTLIDQFIVFREATARKTGSLTSGVTQCVSQGTSAAG